MKSTHIGILRRCDNRTPEDYFKDILFTNLRETKLYYIMENNEKYYKNTGRKVGCGCHMYYLDLDSIASISI
jgi:hypothetical protein